MVKGKNKNKGCETSENLNLTEPSGNLNLTVTPFNKNSLKWQKLLSTQQKIWTQNTNLIYQKTKDRAKTFQPIELKAIKQSNEKKIYIYLLISSFKILQMRVHFHTANLRSQMSLTFPFCAASREANMLRNSSETSMNQQWMRFFPPQQN